MRVLLDSNVWRYLVDSKRQDQLYKLTKEFDVKIVVCPAIVIETLRLTDSKLRKKIIEVQTRDCWERLMPDAFLECFDLKKELIRTHPEWELSKKNTALYKKLRFDWLRTAGGFWSKARKNTDLVAAHYAAKDAALLDRARQQARQMRSTVINSSEGRLQDRPLNALTGSWTLPNSNKVEVDFWRVYAETIWLNMLIDSNSSFRQWMSCELNLDLMLSHYCSEDWLNFWRHEVNLISVPREWLRAAIYCLQSDRKITDGNPTDAQIAVHLVDIDYFISADKNFVSILSKCYEEAPFKIANPLLVNAGNAGVDQFFQMISEKFIVHSK